MVLGAGVARISYDTVETLIYDPVSANRMATRSALHTIGFRRVESVATVEALAEHFQRRPPDLAICEITGSEDALCRAIQALRQGLTAYNPFIVVIVTTWDKQNALIGKVINSGADDLILRPFSTAQMETRIRTHVERRKGFVITSDYVGPDRRRGDDRGSSAELFQPPNSLKLKAVDRLTEEAAAARLDAELSSARDKLTSEKLRREAFHICVLWRLMQAASGRRERYEVDLASLRDVARAIARRARETVYETAVEWCDSILAAVEGLELGVDRNASMHLLGHAALHLNQVFSPDKSLDENLAEVDATVTAVKARQALAS